MPFQNLRKFGTNWRISLPTAINQHFDIGAHRDLITANRLRDDERKVDGVPSVERQQAWRSVVPRGGVAANPRRGYLVACSGVVSLSLVPSWRPAAAAGGSVAFMADGATRRSRLSARVAASVKQP